MYIKGDWWMVCDRCGFNYRRSQMRETWEGLWVCKEDWEPKHPQLSIKAKRDDQRVPVVRTDKDCAAGSTTTSVAASEGSKILTLTNASNLSSGDSVGVTLDNGEVQWMMVGAMNFTGGYANSLHGDCGGTLQSTFQSPFSLSCYMTAKDGNPSTTQMLFGSKNNAGEDSVECYIQSGTSKLTIIYEANNNQAKFTSSSIFNNGRNSKTHIIVSFSADYIRLYVDNVQQDYETLDGDMSGVTMGDFATDKNYYVGAINYTNLGDLYHFDGLIDNFQVHTSAISTMSTYGYSSVIGLSEGLRGDVASGNTVILPSSAGVNFLSSAVSVDDL